MVGNDIVDMNETRRSTNWERPGFLQKIFTEKEQIIISTSSNIFTTVWRLWSMKESAYKVFIQAGGKPFFSPTRIECTIKSSRTGEVKIGTLNLKTITSLNNDYIFSTATFYDSKIDSEIFPFTENSIQRQSNFIYQKILNNVAEVNSMDPTELYLQKTQAGIPQIYYKNKAQNILISITHHGKYGAYSILKNKNDE